MMTILDRAIREKAEELARQGQFYAMLTALQDHVEGGIDQGRFTRAQAQADLELALQVAYADLNIDEYESYLQAIRWLERVRDKAEGCGVWYYRYGVACLYTGQLEKALALVEEGARQQPDYAWNWLYLAKLRAHFGDKAGALAALDQGEPLAFENDRFARTRSQIEAGASLEEMERQLAGREESEPEEEDGLVRSENDIAVMCILLDQENLSQVKQALGAENWQYAEPYCFFTLPYGDGMLNGRFDMNEAGVSKFSAFWIARLIARLPELDAGAKARVRQDNGECRLELGHLIFERSGCFKLGYHVGRSREERLFAYLRFDPAFVPEPDPEYSDYSENGYEEEGSDPEEQAPQLPLEQYDPQQRRLLELHIRRYYGPIQKTLREAGGAGVQVDIHVIAPTREKNYYTLITSGMGAHQMRVPQELAGYHVDRAELVICLPPDWKLEDPDEKWYWPLRWLRLLARLPIEQDTWLGWGHTVPNGRPFAVNTMLSGVILTGPMGVSKAAGVCKLQDGSEVNLYQVVPLYSEEMEYKLEHDAEALLQRMEQQGLLKRQDLQLDRPNACGDGLPDPPTDPELLERLLAWHEAGEYQQIVDTVLAIPEEQRSYVLTGQLARALNNLQRYEEAIACLMATKQKGRSDPLWHFRLGYAYYYLGREREALTAFLRADDLSPGDEDTELFLRWCRSAIALPVSVRPFRERVEEYWRQFACQEQELRRCIDQRETEGLLDAHEALLDIAFKDVAFEAGYNGSQYELVLCGEGNVSRLLKYLYWRDKAPRELWERWNFVVGRRPARTWQPLRAGGELVNGEDTLYWAVPEANETLGVELYSPALARLKAGKDPAEALRAASELLEQALGEVAALRHLAWLDVLEEPRTAAGTALDQLRGQMARMFCQGDEALLDQADLLAAEYHSYRCDPTQRENWVLRQDVIAGSSCCGALVRSYYRNDETLMDDHQADGVICGFLFYSNEGIPEEEQVALRGRLEDQLAEESGDCARILGGAVGFAYSYIDCMCFDLKAFLNAASDLLNQYPFEEIGFHVFRVECGGVNLKEEPEEAPESDE